MWTRTLLLGSLTLSWACGQTVEFANIEEAGTSDAGVTDAARPAPPAYVPPRLDSLGDDSWVSYNSAGYPTQMQFHLTRYTLTWSAWGGKLLTADIESLWNEHPPPGSVSFRYDEKERAVGATMRRPKGSNVPNTTMTVQYGTRGEITTWSMSGAAYASFTRAYTYNDLGQVVEIDVAQPRHEVVTETLTYNEDGCPLAATLLTGRGWAERFGYTYADRRLVEYTGFDLVASHPVTYDQAGRIHTMSVFSPIRYKEGEARGLDLFPGQYLGEYGWGYPAHSAVFRLDGRCDASMTSQPRILTMMLSSLGNSL